MSIGLPKGMTRDNAYVQGLADGEERRLKIWDVTLTCDHKLLVAAPTKGEALDIAAEEAAHHDAEPNQIEEVNLDQAGVLVWYPGPWSKDAVTG